MTLEDPHVVIIGAGIGGLSSAIALKRQLGYNNFTIYERSSGLGGTWNANRYPGSACDVASHFYCLSTDPNPNWTSTHPFQPEILAYWQKLAEKYHIRPHIRFNCKVLDARWDSIKHQYDILAEDLVTHGRISTIAQIIISAIGILDVPRLPDIPGMGNFKGQSFHSADWPDSIDLRGKRVAVIGSGASAIQFVPIIAKEPDTKVTQFCRTPTWLVESARSPFSSHEQWLFKNLPFYARLYRWYSYIRSDMMYFLILKKHFISDFIMGMLREYVLKTAPQQYHEKLIPTFGLGCKRILYDAGYLKSLHQPNLKLNWDGISCIVEDGIITNIGEIFPCDIVIFATGFDVENYPITVTGNKPQTIQEYFDSQGGPKAYLGTTLPGFPNFFTILGANTGTGHASVLFIEETQINYIIQLIKPILQQKITSIEVTAQATDAYNAKIHQKLSGSVFTQCSSYYRVGGNGKVAMIFPGPISLFWWWARRPDWTHYTVRKGSAEKAYNVASTRAQVLSAALLVLVLLAHLDIVTSL